MINQIVSHYKILRELGRGAMGEVYLAEDTYLPRLVALKFMSLSQASQPDAHARFKHEVWAIASINHPNIITIYDVGEFESRPYFVMEYVEGESLGDLMGRKELQVNEILDITIQICEGLSKAHQKGVLHRDLKPSNILMDRDGRVKIIDFGLARLQDNTKITATGVMMGTVAYMSPEQARSEELDQRSDLFSLGVVLYEMIARQCPFTADFVEAILYQIINIEPEPLARYKRGVPTGLQSIVDKALDKDRETRYQNVDSLLADLKREKKIFSLPLPQTITIAPARAEAEKPPLPATKPRRVRIFISYKRNVEPDQSVAQQIYQALSSQHEVFIDQTMLVGSQWVGRIMEELHRTDFLITLLSEHSVNSEMVQEEIRVAHNLAEPQRGSPVILPVRLAYSEPFPYPLSEYLNAIHWAFWQGPEDTPQLIEALKKAMAGSVLPIGDEEAKAKIIRPSPLQQLPPPFAQAQPVISARIESPEGTMDPQSGYYVERPSDGVARSAIQRQGETITIKAPRQMGKSSLLLRIIEQATKINKRVVFFDFQQFDKSALRQADSFFRQFCSWLTYKLIMQDQVDTYWKIPLGNIQRCTSYVEEYVLKELNDRLVLAMDEVETIFDTDFRSDFFGMLRSWHNSRREGSIWKQLDLVLVTSTEPYQFVDNLNQSPFNVGEVIALTDFTPAHIADLNHRHGSPLTPQEEQQLLQLVGGQPYLVRRALYLIASKRMTTAELFVHATDDRGPFGDHLRNHLFRLHGRQELIEGLLQVIHKGTCQDDHVYFRLRGAGLVRKGEGRAVLPRCQLYAHYFREQLHV
jgi:serine/threonine protein kinase